MLPDLFKGQQLVIFGRYIGDGSQPITLRGQVNGQAREFTFESTFAAQSTREDFVPRLWAVRKVGFLMNEIRMNGVSEELRQEIVRLGTRFGIVTPYTSFLAVDDSELQGWRPGMGGRPVRPGIPEEGMRRDAAPPSPERGFGGNTAGGGSPEGRAPWAADEADMARELESEANRPSAQAGGAAVDRAREVDRLRRASGVDDTQSANRSEALRRTIGTKLFLHLRGWWVDTAFDAAIHTGERRVEVTTFSEAYFALLRERPELARYAALGTDLVVVIDGTAYVFQSAEPAAEEGAPDGE